jgi:DNA-binding MarR family transcriptional regulator
MDLSRPAGDLVEVVSLFIRGVSAGRSLSLTAVAVLGYLDRSGPQRITDLAAAEGVSQPSMTQLVQRLQQRGLVSRASDPADGRVALVSLTSKGRSVLAERRRQNAERVAQWLDGLPEEDAIALARGLAAALPVIRKHIAAQAQPPASIEG